VRLSPIIILMTISNVGGSDLLAELDLPHSGITQFEETVGLPGGFDPTPMSPRSPSEEVHPAGRDELWYFLAEVALRRLLNRVSNLLYNNRKTSSTNGAAGSVSLSSLAPIVSELDYQLEQWYESLPVTVQFPHGHVPLSNPVQTVLRLRYFACRTIIYRPYVLAVLEREEDGGADLGPQVRENSRRCLEACIRQLEVVTAQ
jgi:hypothetical protein